MRNACRDALRLAEIIAHPIDQRLKYISVTQPSSREHLLVAINVAIFLARPFQHRHVLGLQFARRGIHTSADEAEALGGEEAGENAAGTSLGEGLGRDEGEGELLALIGAMPAISGGAERAPIRARWRDRRATRRAQHCRKRQQRTSGEFTFQRPPRSTERRLHHCVRVVNTFFIQRFRLPQLRTFPPTYRSSPADLFR